AGVKDVIRFAPGIAVDQLWFRKVGSNLEVSVIGTSDKIAVSGWYTDSMHHIEIFELAGGQQLLDTEVQNLVQAMARLTPPAGGQTELSASYHQILDSVFAASWH